MHATLSVSVLLGGMLFAAAATGQDATRVDVPQAAQQASVPASSDPRRPAAEDVAGQYRRAVELRNMVKYGEYGTLTATRRRQIEEPAKLLQKMLPEVRSYQELTPAQRGDYADAVVKIDAWLDQWDPDRVICTMVKGTGSRIEKKECLSVATREARALRGQQFTREVLDSFGCTPADGKLCFQGPPKSGGMPGNP